MAEESAVKVCVRVRPLIERERASGVDENVQLYWRAEKQSIHQIEDVNSGKSFFFDRVFNSDETTNQLYQDFAKPLVVSTVEGYNGTIFAYGQTASGKTFTMMGSDIIPGVIPLAMKDVFQAIKNLPKKEFLLRVSYMEIYNETVTDLLCDSSKRKPLEIREGNHKNVYVGDLTEEVVTSPEQALGWIRKGEKNRHYGKTKMNQRSSRSHTIFRMILESRDRSDTESGESSDGAIIVSHLNLVDLAGSERASQTGAEGARFKEGCNINRSLFILGQVIKKLSDENQKGFTNYRDSKLTRILQNSLGGNAKTVIICTVTTAVIEETISTLQFASAAKKMKNDPHVTEVSDDGALLKRYRNEIEDLKRRLQEVSQVTQATATEKETLSQLLQERDQLQRDQEDRIKNLTNLLVTSSNFLNRRPKRRVTWGGKLLKAAQSNFHDVGENFSFVEPLSKVKKVDLTVLQEDGEFDSHWEIPEETNFDRTDHSNVAMTSFSDSFPCSSESPSQIHSDKLSCLEMELESEALLKKEAMEKVEALERQLEESQKLTEDQEQTRKQFEETRQLCENLFSEKIVMAEERDYLKQELSISIEQMRNFEKENAALQQELQDKKDMEEFMSLEEECKKVQEMELQKDISSLKLVLETSELARKELEANLQSMSEELKRKNELAEELQSLNGKDLVQQVSQLRRSLDDAEMLSRDTKKDWAFLRSDNISLKEKAAVLTADHEKMENEVKGLRCQLETAKTRFIQMQKDLQTELQVTFDENTKLTILLDGKVPKNLIDGMALEKSVATLRKTVSASQEEAALLRAQNEELISLQHLPDQVDCLTKQVQDLTQELCEVKTQRDSLLSAERKLSEHMESQPTPQLESLRVDLEHASSENLRLLATVEDFTLRLKDSERVQAAGEQKLCEVQDLVKDLEEKLADSELSCSTVEKIGKELQEESDHLKEILEGLREEKNQLKTDVEEKMEMLVQIQAELQQQQQMNYKQQELLSRLGEERDQLKTDLAENVEMMIENQQELRDSLEKNCQQKEQILQLKNGATVELQNQINKLTEELESVRVERDRLLSEKTAGPQNSNEERDQLLSTVTSLTGERDQLLSTVTSLSEERDQLTEIVKGLRDERNQLKTDAEESTNSMQHMTVQMESLNVKARQLEDNVKKHVEMAAETEGLLHSIKEELQQQMQLNTNLESQHLEVEESLKQMSEELESVRVERDRLLSEKTAGPQNSTAERDQLLSTVTLLSKERDQLLSTVTSLSEERDQLLSTVTSPSEARDQLLFTVTSPSEARDQLLSTVTSLSEARDQLLSTVTSPSEERDQLLSTVTSLSEERDQLLSTVTSLTGERNELLSTVTSFSEERDQLLSTVTSLSEERDQLLSTVTSLSEERDQLLSTVTSLSEERDQLLSTVTSLSEERDQLLSTVTSLSEERDQLFSTVTSLTGERDELLSTVTSLTGERDELLSTVTSLTGERDELLSTVTSLSEERDQLLSTVTSLSEERDQLLSTVTSLTGERDQLLSTVTSLTGERDQLLSTVTSLTGERDQLLSTVTSLTGERDQLLSTVTSLTGERDQLLSTVTSLTGERDELNEILEGLRGRRDQLKAELEDKIETLVQIQVELQQQQKLNCEQRELLERLQRERDQLETKQQEYVERKPLKDELHDGEHSQHCAKGEVEALQQLLSDANVTISKLKQTNCGTEMAAEGLALRLQDSARQVQEILEKFMRCRETCSEVESAALYGVLPMASTLMKPLLRSLPKHLVKSHCSIGLHGSKTFRTLSDMKLTTKECALECKRLMEDTVRFDLAVFEERRLQDVLLCRAQAPSYSVAQDNLKMLWDQRLVHLLDKRPHYFQKMENVLNQMEANLACQSAAFSSEVKEMDLFNEQLRPLCSSQPLDLDALDALLRREFARRSDVNERQKMALEAIIGAKRAHASQVEELRVQAHGQLREERSRTSTLLQALERGPAKTELQLLKDNQQLLLQLEKCRRDYESVVKNLPKDAPPSAAELDKLRAKLVKMEVEMIAASSKHQEEMERMTVLLNHKENTLRKLRESLRRTQLGEEDTFSQGADLHAKLTATRGYTPQRSALEKKKMEEVQMLKMNITELKSLVSSQQAEMSKLKSRAKAKGKTVAKVEKLLSPCTPTKRHTLSAVENTEAPNPNKRFLDSPTVPLASPSAALLQSPKSNFFDIHSGCESMSMNCPKQFFDNTSLGTIPDANAGADVNEGLWPLSPKQADLCKQQ